MVDHQIVSKAWDVRVLDRQQISSHPAQGHKLANSSISNNFFHKKNSTWSVRNSITVLFSFLFAKVSNRICPRSLPHWFQSTNVLPNRVLAVEHYMRKLYIYMFSSNNQRQRHERNEYLLSNHLQSERRQQSLKHKCFQEECEDHFWQFSASRRRELDETYSPTRKANNNMKGNKPREKG